MSTEGRDLVMDQMSEFFERGALDEAAEILEKELARSYDPAVAASLFGIHLYRDASDAAQAVLGEVARHAPGSELPQLGDLVTALGLYARRRNSPEAAQSRRGITGEPEPWQVARLAAEVHHARGEHDMAKNVLAESTPPAVAGRYRRYNGAEAEFTNLTDSDDLRGPVFVCIAEGEVLDIPFSAVKRLDLLPAKTLFGRVVPPAVVELRDARVLDVRIPIRYPGSGSHESPPVRLGRQTTFDYDAGYCVAYGMVDLRPDTALVGLGTITAIEFD